MFLFSTPPASPRDTGASREAGTRGTAGATGRTGAPNGVIEAIRDGAQTSGAGFDYLLATARRESALDPSAKAGTSSATGLFQFIEQTWLGTMKNAGPRLGLATYADAITRSADGSYTVSDPSARQTILDLRRDPRIAATMAGALTERNREALTAALGREPTGGDLYAAHVLGARGAAALIATAQASPARVAALDMPEAAAANRGLFYDRSGRPRGAAELYAHLSAAQAGTAPVASPLVPPEGTTAYASLNGGGLRSMFQTDARQQGGVSPGVARLWQGRAQEAGRQEAGRQEAGRHEASRPDSGRGAPTYFPRSEEAAPVPAVLTTTDASPSSTATDAPTPATSAPLVGAPPPPRRPPEFGAPGRTARTGAPLDLSLFTIRSGS